MVAVTERKTQKVSKQQMRLLESNAREVLLSGAFGSGKTWAICLKAVQHAQIPGNLVFLGRNKFTDLRQTTLRVLLKGEGGTPPVLPPGSYTHNKNEHLISLYGGGDIFYGGFDQELKLASLNLGCACIDEAIEIEEDEYMMILGRLRNAADKNPQICLATNPGPPTHYLYGRFSIEDPDQIAPGREVILSDSRDNPFLPETYLELLATFMGQHKARYVEGLWVAFEGLVYAIDRELTFRARTITGSARVIAGVDEGYTNAFALVVLADMDGEVYVPEAFGDTEMLESRKVKQAKFLQEKYNISAFYVDPSAADLIAAMRAADLHALPADNAVFDGIQRCIELFGRNRMCINPELSSGLIRELDGYSWKDGKDEPVKVNDHYCDALRYAVGGMRRGQVTVDFVGGEPEHEGEWCSVDNEAIWEGE